MADAVRREVASTYSITSGSVDMFVPRYLLAPLLARLAIVPVNDQQPGQCQTYPITGGTVWLGLMSHRYHLSSTKHLHNVRTSYHISASNRSCKK